MTPPSPRAARLLERLGGVVALDLEVTGVDDVAPGLREVRLAGALEGFEPWPGQDVMVSVPPGSDAATWRRYTLRRVDPVAGTLALWVTTTTDGPGASWALRCAPGDRVEAVGPRGKIALREDAATHLFVVDESGLGAACAMTEALVAPASVFVFSLLVPDPGWLPDEAIAPTPASGVAVTKHVLLADDLDWAAYVLERAVRRAEDPGAIAAYVFGELAMSRRITEVLVGLGCAPDRVATKAYWRDGRANEDNGEPARGSE